MVFVFFRSILFKFNIVKNEILFCILLFLKKEDHFKTKKTRNIQIKILMKKKKYETFNTFPIIFFTRIGSSFFLVLFFSRTKF